MLVVFVVFILGWLLCCYIHIMIEINFKCDYQAAAIVLVYIITVKISKTPIAKIKVNKAINLNKANLHAS